MLKKRLLHSKATVLSVLLALTVTLFIGCFANPPINMDDSFSGNHWHIFTRPGNKPLTDLFYSSGEVIIATPDLWETIVLIQKFIKQASGILK